MNPRFVALVGPTAAGKTSLAVEAVEASGVPVEIIVLDSRQLYRGLDVGTGKPDADERARVPHHLLDCLEPDETPDAMDYRRRVEEAAGPILARGAVPFLVGGAGFYLRALREGFHELDHDPETLAALRAELERMDDGALRERLGRLDPATASRLHPNDRYRIGRAIEICELGGRPASELEARFEPRPVLGASFDVAVLLPPRELLHERIARRTAAWLDGGWEREVRELLDRGVAADAPGLRILGYREVVALVLGELQREAALERIVVATRRYARSQRTWFRKERPALALDSEGPPAVEAMAALLAAAGRSS